MLQVHKGFKEIQEQRVILARRVFKVLQEIPVPLDHKVQPETPVHKAYRD